MQGRLSNYYDLLADRYNIHNKHSKKSWNASLNVLTAWFTTTTDDDDCVGVNLLESSQSPITSVSALLNADTPKT